MDQNLDSGGLLIMNLYFVFLRRPRSPDDRRDDPFWEFGSFGRTGCHHANLLNPKRSLLREGDRLAFLQGGSREIRIVGLTPPISTVAIGSRLEALWNANYKPVPYEQAPILIRNDGYTDFLAILPFLANTGRSTYVGAAGSRLRSRTRPMNGEISTQVLTWFSQPATAEAEQYIEMITPSSSRWFREARRRNWADREHRHARYEDLRGG